MYGGYLDGVIGGISAKYSLPSSTYDSTLYSRVIKRGRDVKRAFDWRFFSVLNKVYEYPGGGVGNIASPIIFNEMLNVNAVYSDASIIMEYPLPLVFPNDGIFSDKKIGISTEKILYFPRYTNNYNGYFQEFISDHDLTGDIKLQLKDSKLGDDTNRHFKKIYSITSGVTYYNDDFGGEECTGTAVASVACPGSSGDVCLVSCEVGDQKEHVTIKLGTSTDRIAIAYEITAGGKDISGNLKIFQKQGMWIQ